MSLFEGCETLQLEQAGTCLNLKGGCKNLMCSNTLQELTVTHSRTLRLCAARPAYFLSSSSYPGQVDVTTFAFAHQINMDVFEALGLDVPDNTRSMSVTDADADDLMAFLAPVFGWDDKEASANRCGHGPIAWCLYVRAPALLCPQAWVSRLLRRGHCLSPYCTFVIISISAFMMFSNPSVP